MTFKQLIAYLKGDPSEWFKPVKPWQGWGLGPATWQGWVIIIIVAAFLIFLLN